MRKVNLIVVHCSASPNGDDIGAAEIDGWHHARGFERMEGWRKAQNYGLKSIGYHFVIRCVGEVQTGRHIEEIGAHVAGFNQRSVGICLVGSNKFTPAQWVALRQLVATLKAQFPGADVLGHRDLSPDLNHNGVIERNEWLKDCPNFDVKKWMAYGEPPQESVLEVAHA